MDLSELLRQQHGLRVERLADGRHHIMVEPDQGCAGTSESWTTAYPPELIEFLGPPQAPEAIAEVPRTAVPLAMKWPST